MQHVNVTHRYENVKYVQSHVGPWSGISVALSQTPVYYYYYYYEVRHEKKLML